jgi:ABC-type lipoprotein release transport system permease subunit
MLGVEPVFLEMTNTQNHLGEGVALLENQGEPRALIGANVLAKLEGYIPKQIGTESVVCYVPKRGAKIRPGKSPFSQERIALSGSVRYNREVSSDAFIIPIDLAKKLMGYGNDINAIYIDAEPGVDNSVLKERVAATLGADFVVKTSYEKNELIFKTSQSERVIVLIILLFIFVLAAFNLVASLTMLFVEKRDDVRTMISYGIPRSYIFRIFFFEGLLISGKGILIGLVLGYGVCAAQLQWALLKMPNSNGESFPIAFSFSDGLIIFGLVTLLSVLFSYFPVRYLIRKNIEA